MTISVFGFYPIFGFNAVLETFVSQAYGNRNMRMCGVYLNRGRFMILCLFVPIMILLLNVESILVSLG